METESCTVKFTETDDGFRIDVTGRNLKEVMSSKPKYEMAVCSAGQRKGARWKE